MNVRGSLTLALRYLGIGSGKTVSNARKSLYGAIAGIGISIVPLVIVLVVSNGMIEGITSRLVELSSSHIHVTDYTGISDIPGDPARMTALAETIAADNPGGRVVSATPERQGMAIAIGKKGRSGSTVRAVPQDFFSGNPALAALVSVKAGDTALSGERDVILGQKLASDIGVEVGDGIRLVTMRTGPTGMTIPKFSSFRVSGIISSGYQELDALWAFVPYETGCALLSAETSANFINVRVTDPFTDIERARSWISRDLPDDMAAYTWKEMNRSQFQSFSTTRTLLLFIMLLIVLVASVNVSSALVMLVMERRKEIAILKSTGTHPSEITLSFIFAGFFTGLGGILIGMPAGIACALSINGIISSLERCVNAVNRAIAALASGGVASGSSLAEIKLLDPAYYIQVIPVHLRFWELFSIASGALILSVVFSLIPAMRAGSEKPIDTLRKV